MSRQPSSGLGSLPDEIYEQIGLYLTLYDIFNLTLCTRRLRAALKAPAFGREFLARDAENLRVEVVQPLPITGLDCLQFGILDEPSGDLVNGEGSKRYPNRSKPTTSPLRQITHFVHHRTPTTSDLHTVTVRSSGAVTVGHRPIVPGPVTCSLSPNLTSATDGSSDIVVNVTSSHRATCQLCNAVPIRKICYWIDKRYRVFFQTWADAFEFTESHQPIVRMTLVHQEEREGIWDGASMSPNSRNDWYSQFVPQIAVYRYGLLQSQDRGLRLEHFFGLTDDVDQCDDREPQGQALEQVQADIKLWNPWA
ncbi:uncharacterized protein SPPG_04791 [Spizellomyces punctatus DAOM BR117]|uniref:F-box domain-containing protein n=1 Tax=Spizellomyces punctatus (strain DAOM BR117) TaxID=645134 RepID=A0A0L0HHY5_SPIPD|nr:uncharacterized protein SPPG_04791 [Spizellomyces punctatus DAOM BR117]KND00475.1 hypothetical protein SPPG_04791 [Spizellomyces punctatus DAOM BR117]|eukprot:XP_016608514.1 hypothetical protein SPPG_04791 [Spizellomyces punctatus DAOM BR117]